MCVLCPAQTFDGRLELFYNRPTTIQHIRARRPIWYVVHFPVQSPLPQLKEIVFNQRVLCKPADFAGVNKFVTEYRLHHILYTGLANHVYAPLDEPTLDNDGGGGDGGSEELNNVPHTSTESAAAVAALDAKRIIE